MVINEHDPYYLNSPIYCIMVLGVSSIKHWLLFSINFFAFAMC